MHYRAVVGVDRNLSRARNSGAQAALDDGADQLIFLDADCLPGPSAVSGYVRAMQLHPEGVLAGPVTYLKPPGEGGYDLESLTSLTDPHPARPAPPAGEIVAGEASQWPLFWSLSFALTARTWQRIGGFNEEFTGYGGEDTDFAFRARQTGHTLYWVGGAHAYHQWHPVSSPPVEHVDDIVANAQLFHSLWGEWPMEGWLRAFEERGLVEFRDSTWRRIAPTKQQTQQPSH
ncbi:glycosyltransferase family 2 protein [Corynebacterium tapiri]|uniref:Glycosyltransferase family 2 protein n=1 Tax=Corynebacterium tapiri TaxID=1448266 RepID=A0A5C4U7V1_9CORY|nr:galactosyltransferase-related protein [Corynebacterium tapiri]TNL99771.1 glycosyltransferase family 2 protein [Corynebacterium tapiri]